MKRDGITIRNEGKDKTVEWRKKLSGEKESVNQRQERNKKNQKEKNHKQLDKSFYKNYSISNTQFTNWKWVLRTLTQTSNTTNNVTLQKSQISHTKMLMD